MVLKGTYKVNYTLNREPTEMVVKVELKQNPDLGEPRMNVWRGYATVDGLPYEDEELSHCVNAQYAAESIGRKLTDERKAEAKANGDSFRIKRRK